VVVEVMDVKSRTRIDITISMENKIFLELMRRKYGVCSSELIDEVLTQLRSGKIEDDGETIVIRFLGLITARRGRCYERG